MPQLFQQIIPIGEECYSCQAIDKKFNKDLRNYSLPFDYVAGTNLCRLMPVFDDIFHDRFSLSSIMCMLKLVIDTLKVDSQSLK